MTLARQIESFTFGTHESGMSLDCGSSLGPITLAYETYGTLNEDRSNAVLVLHAWSGGAHAAGLSGPEEGASGWWDFMIGPGSAIDTDRYFVICPNSIGSCWGSTGPGSINPADGRAYGMRFPVITIEDMVRAERRLMDHLGIERLSFVVGGSLGGMRALQWAVTYPERVARVGVIAATARTSAQQIGLNAVVRQAITAETAWNHGDYYEQADYERIGLMVARMVGHITFLSEEMMNRRFGNELIEGPDIRYTLEPEFQIESYLLYNAGRFARIFDPNSYMYLSRAMDYFDVSDKLDAVQAKALVVSFTSDWLYPTQQSKELALTLHRAGKWSAFCELEARAGHDSFLKPHEPMESLVRAFLSNTI